MRWMETPQRATEGGGRDRWPVALLAGLTLVGAGFWLVTYLTAEPPERDFFDSPFYWCGSLLLPAISGAAGWLRPHPSAADYGVATVLPQVVAVTLLGTVFHKAEYGASLWVVGLIFVLVQMAIASAVAVAASAMRRHGRRPELS